MSHNTTEVTMATMVTMVTMSHNTTESPGNADTDPTYSYTYTYFPSTATLINIGTPNKIADLVLAVLVILFSVVASVGNISAFLYFWQKKNKCLAPLLYTVISVVDIATSFSVFPIISSLLNGRDPTFMRGSSYICKATLIVMTFTQKVSMFLVMLLSFTRTLAIASPYYKIRNALIMPAILIYGAVLVTIDTVYLGKGWLKPVYRKWLAFCGYQVPLGVPRSTFNLYAISVQMELFFPGLIVLVSFIVFTCALLRKSKYHDPGEEEVQNRRISVTIAMFTGVFLLCNLPYFLTQLVFLCEVYSLQFHVSVYNNSTFRWYSGLVSNILTLLNAALNPCLYLLRMPHYRSWLNFLSQNPGSIRTILTEPARSSAEFDRFALSRCSPSADPPRPGGSRSPQLSVGAGYYGYPQLSVDYPFSTRRPSVYANGSARSPQLSVEYGRHTSKQGGTRSPQSSLNNYDRLSLNRSYRSPKTMKRESIKQTEF